MTPTLLLFVCIALHYNLHTSTSTLFDATDTHIPSYRSLFSFLSLSINILHRIILHSLSFPIFLSWPKGQRPRQQGDDTNQLKSQIYFTVIWSFVTAVLVHVQGVVTLANICEMSLWKSLSLSFIVCLCVHVHVCPMVFYLQFP